MERGHWEDQNFQPKEVQLLKEEDISFEASHSLPAKVNGLPAPFNLSCTKNVSQKNDETSVYFLVCYLTYNLSKRVKISTGQNNRSWKTEYTFDAWVLADGEAETLCYCEQTQFSEWKGSQWSYVWMYSERLDCRRSRGQIGWAKSGGRMLVAYLKKRGMLGLDAFKSHLIEKGRTLN
jgi:hypothetical protein